MVSWTDAIVVSIDLIVKRRQGEIHRHLKDCVLRISAAKEAYRMHTSSRLEGQGRLLGGRNVLSKRKGGWKWVFRAKAIRKALSEEKA